MFRLRVLSCWCLDQVLRQSTLEAVSVRGVPLFVSPWC